jgi:hypothetical protein
MRHGVISSTVPNLHEVELFIETQSHHFKFYLHLFRLLFTHLLAPPLFVDMSAMFLKLPGLLLLHQKFSPSGDRRSLQPTIFKVPLITSGAMFDVRDARDASKCFESVILIVDVGMRMVRISDLTSVLQLYTFHNELLYSN